MQTSVNTGTMPAKTYVRVGQIKPLGAKLEAQETADGCNTHGGEGKASCGSSGGPLDMPEAIWDKVKNHPCYSEKRTTITRGCMLPWHLLATFNVTIATASTTAATSRALGWCRKSSRPSRPSEKSWRWRAKFRN